MFSENFVRAVQLLIKKNVPTQTVIGKVKSVNGNTCVIERESITELLDVRLNSIVGNLKSQIITVPKVGSYVLCTIIENQESEAYIIATSEIESVQVWFDENKTKGFIMDSNGVVFDNGNNGGATITPELRTQLDKLSKRLDDVMNAILTAGTTTYGGVLMTGVVDNFLTIVDKEDFANIENERLKH